MAAPSREPRRPGKARGGVVDWATVKRRQFLRNTGIAAACAVLDGPAFAAAGLRARLGVTSDEISNDLEVALRLLQSFGLGWVELRKVWGQNVTELSLEDCKRARALMDRYKVRLSVLDTAMYKCDLPGLPSGRKEDYPFDGQDAVLARALERAPILGTRFIRIFSFWRPSAAALDEPGFKRVVEHLSKASDKARAAKATLLLENVNGANVETSVEAARLLAAIPSPAFGLAWDPNNAYCGKETPFPDGYRALDRKRIHHIHLRDAGWDPETKKCKWLPVGKGQVDNLGLLRALAKDRFPGTLTLETHYARPDGNKELATRESLQGLLPLFDRATT